MSISLNAFIVLSPESNFCLSGIFCVLYLLFYVYTLVIDTCLYCCASTHKIYSYCGFLVCVNNMVLTFPGECILVFRSESFLDSAFNCWQIQSPNAVHKVQRFNSLLDDREQVLLGSTLSVIVHSDSLTHST